MSLFKKLIPTHSQSKYEYYYPSPAAFRYFVASRVDLSPCGRGRDNTSNMRVLEQVRGVLQ